MKKRVKYQEEDGKLDLSMSDLQEVPVRDLVSPVIFLPISVCPPLYNVAQKRKGGGG